MERAMNDKYGEEFDKERPGNSLKTLKEKYNNVKELLSGSGFGWNDATTVVTAEETVWDDFIAVRFPFLLYAIALFAYEWFRFM
ncbi:hypothetical protein AMTRI_Chr13g83490 [Amborella trichopoda]